MIPQPQGTQGTNYAIPSSLLQAIVNYLQKKPFDEVADLIGNLMSVCRTQDQANQMAATTQPSPNPPGAMMNGQIQNNQSQEPSPQAGRRKRQLMATGAETVLPVAPPKVPEKAN